MADEAAAGSARRRDASKRRPIKKKKLPSAERRRLRNTRLCRLLAGRSAEMALNELLPPGGTMKFQVAENAPKSKWKATLALLKAEGDGQYYEGLGYSPRAARGAAAELAALDLLAPHMGAAAAAAAAGPGDSDGVPLLMLHLASLGLSKLRRDWKGFGRRLTLPMNQKQKVDTSALQCLSLDEATSAGDSIDAPPPNK